MSRHAMPNADAAWLHMDRPTNRAIINSVLWFDEPLELEAVRGVLRERIVERFPSFRCRAVEHGALGGVDWEDDGDFELDLHLHHVALPAPGDRPALQQLVGDLASTPLDRDKPLWDAYLIDGYGSGCALLLRIHHCIADGVALTRVLLSMTDHAGRRGARSATGNRAGQDEARHLLPGALEPLARAGLDVAGSVVHAGRELILHPRRLADLAGYADADTRALAELLLAPHDPESAIHGELGPVQRVAWSEPFLLAQVKVIAHAHDATVNDVLVSAVAGALGRHLEDADTAVDEIRAMVPFNLRPLDEPLPVQLGNRFGLVLLGLPVAITDPAARLRAVTERMSAITRSRQGQVTYGILEAIGVAPVAVEDSVIEFFSAKSSLVLTNVPGPTEPVYLAGVRVGGVLAWAPYAGSMSMSVSVFSYADDVSVGFLVDGGLVPDPDMLVAHFADELQALTALT